MTAPALATSTEAAPATTSTTGATAPASGATTPASGATTAASGATAGGPPKQRMLDPRGVRFGAGSSVVVLAIAFALNAPILVAAIWLGLGASALFGTQYWPLSRPWPYVRTVLRLGPPQEFEAEYPPRFAQALGATVLTPAIALFILGVAPLAWLLVGAVAALQALLAVTGYCLGCRLYFLRWWVPSLFDRITRRLAAIG
jgi:hypothetical protein